MGKARRLLCGAGLALALAPGGLTAQDIPSHAAVHVWIADTAYGYASDIAFDRPSPDMAADPGLIAIAEVSDWPLNEVIATTERWRDIFAPALTLLIAGGEPFQDPPEPFLEILWTSQAIEQQTVTLEIRAKAAAGAGQPWPELTYPALRPSLDPRLTSSEMGNILRALIWALWDNPDWVNDPHFVATHAALTYRDQVPLALYLGLRAEDAPSLHEVGSVLLVPPPDSVTDLTENETDEVIRRLGLDSTSWLEAAYYIGLLAGADEHIADRPVGPLLLPHIRLRASPSFYVVCVAPRGHCFRLD